MSDTLRVALVAEGPTDKVVIEAAIASLTGGRSFVLRQLHPEESLAFGMLGTGWAGVYRWCRQTASRAGGAVHYDPLYSAYDILILHLDAEVARENYANGSIADPVNDLPCEHPCPPPADTTNALRLVLLRWLGEPHLPHKTVLCTPSKTTDAWVLSALYPHDAIVAAGGVECFPTPAVRLQTKPHAGRLVSGGRKNIGVYRARSPEIAANWQQARQCCSEAERFSVDFLSQLPAPDEA